MSLNVLADYVFIIGAFIGIPSILYGIFLLKQLIVKLNKEDKLGHLTERDCRDIIVYLRRRGLDV